MAGFAGLRKRAVVRVAVAVRAFGERHSRKPRRPPRNLRCVALRASHLRVQPGERESRLAVVDLRRGFPVHKIVALRAICAELSLVGICVARHAVRRQSQECLAQILDLDLGFHCALDVRRHVALTALDPGVPSLQAVARLVVVEALEGRLPVNQGKVFAIVLGVASRAVQLIFKTRMQPLSAGHFRRNFRVAFLALQNGRALAHHMATGALRRSAESLVRTGQRPR